MPATKIFINENNKPENLPDDPEEIVELVRQARTNPIKSELNKERGVPLIDTSRSNTPYAWVKYGRLVSRGEARTQQFVAKIVNGDADYPVRVPFVYMAFQRDDYVFIVMEYIQGSICNNSDIPKVASAVQALIQIKATTMEPGPQGGGLIEHPFFIDQKACVPYKSVELLQKHVNGILARTGKNRTVDFMTEVQDQGLRLCPSDMDRTNFLRDTAGEIVSIDFGATCFLPPSFFSFALNVPRPYTQLLAGAIKLPLSPQLDVMMDAAYALVPYGKNEIGLPAELKVLLDSVQAGLYIPL